MKDYCRGVMVEGRWMLIAASFSGVGFDPGEGGGCFLESSTISIFKICQSSEPCVLGSLLWLILIKTEVAFLEGRLLSSQSEKIKKYSKSLIGWKKAGLLKQPLLF